MGNVEEEENNNLESKVNHQKTLNLLHCPSLTLSDYKEKKISTFPVLRLFYFPSMIISI